MPKLGRPSEHDLGYTKRFNRGGERAKQLRKYGLTLEDYDFMLAYQKGLCGICKRANEVTGRRLAVDHCHETGRVRGLLCSNCNTALGLLRDNQDILSRAQRWLMDDVQLGITEQ